MTREEFIAAHPIVDELESRGVKLIGHGNHRTAKCPFHEDSSPSFSVSCDRGLWNCFAGCGGGSVIDLIARFDNRSPADVLRSAAEDRRNGSRPVIFKRSPAPVKSEESAPLGQPTAEYVYRNSLGETIYKVLRYEPKTFRQQRYVGGKWEWGMTDVQRVLYRLPEVMQANEVWITEGEKDAENLTSSGVCGTCNVGGAGKWLDAYSESLAGKDAVICGDNDKPGQDHVKAVFESVARHAKSVRVARVPDGFKDISDFLAATADRRAALQCLRDAAVPHVQGVRLPIYTMAELEPWYRRMVSCSKELAFPLGRWLPSLHRIRPLLPGEVVLVIGDTGVGKTGVLQSLALATKPLPTLFFEMELPAELLWERFIAAANKMDCARVEEGYRQGAEVGADACNHFFPHLYIAPEPHLTPADLERLIHRSELKIGRKPRVVMVDYVQLLGGGGPRYERMSDAAEHIKVAAKATGSIIIVASQVSRQSAAEEIGLHSAKESGSLENSAGVVLGLWRDDEDASLLNLRVLKSTKGGAGMIVKCNFDGAQMRITERAIDDQDVPAPDAAYRPPHPD